MLKKAGIVVAVAAAGVLAVAPLAFAGDVDHSPSCSFGNTSDSSATQTAESILGPTSTGPSTADNSSTPTTTQTNAPTGSCNNSSDLLDEGSNNTTKDVTNSKTVDNSKTVTTSNSTSTITDIVTSITGG